ncbi:MAG: sigma-70 family RNA polymerase sigma factor [Planctomycetota bacterium]
MPEQPADITLLLRSVASGDRAELDELMSAIYDDMRRLAAVHLRHENANHTIQPTALVNEVYLKLIDQRSADWNDRLHFFAFASQVIRRVLIDHARAKNAQKRGGGMLRVPMDPNIAHAETPDADLIALDEALQELAELNERQSRIVELRFFGGCTVDEIATLLGVGARTVDRDWTAAKAWLYARLSDRDA